MSSPDQDDADKLIHEVPWVSDAECQDETRRPQEEALEAAQHLRRKSGEHPSQTGTAPWRPAVGFRLDDQDNAEEMHRRVWAALEPELMSPPPQDGLFGPRVRVFLAGSTGAVVAAVVALLVANVVQIPSLVGGASRADEVGREQANAFGNPSRIAASQAQMQPTDESSVPPGTLLAATPSSEILQPKSPVLSPSVPAALQPARPEIAAPTVATAPAPAAYPEPRPSPSLSRDEVTALLKRGRELIAAGDIASARLILTHVAEAGVAEASLVMAGTYDAVALSKVRVLGLQPDAAKARAWYERAAQQGSWEAKRLLPTLR
jgi:hypothetical protein